jgi:glycosyltransferase involved in cell wall biosynthesis
MPNFLARSITHRFVTGPEAMVDYYEKIVKVKRSKIDLLYNDIQLERFKISNRNDKRASFDIEHGLNPNARVLLLVHRLSPVRRTLLYLEALLRNLDEKLHRDSWFFVIAGGGSELKGAEELAASLGLTNSIHFLGDVPNVLVPDVYAIADVFVNPTYTEGFPRVIIEAMASGLPIVTTDAGGTEQLLGDLQQHYVVDKADYELFANKTLELLTNPAQWDRLAKENLVQVERFSTPEVARMYIRTLFQ